MRQSSQERLEVPVRSVHNGAASPNMSPAETVLDRLRKAGPDLQAHMLLMDQIDFAATSLGPLATWSQELATQFYLTMMTPVAQSITLGPDSIVLYNAAYGKLIRDYHPSYFGRSVTTWVEWAPYFPTMQRILTEAASNGRAVQEELFVMHLPQGGIFEEVSMSITVIALPSPLSGFHATFQDTTLSMVRERRIDSLKEFSECWKSADSLDDLWMKLFNQLSGRPNQFCFTTLYTASSALDAGNASDSSSGGGDSEEVVYAVYPDTDVEKTDSLATIDLTTTSNPLNAYFRKARSTRAPVLLPHEVIPEHWQQLAQSRGFGDICRQAVIIPSSSNKLTKVQAFLILGLSTRRPYDDAYRTFLLEVQRVLADCVINIITAREAANKKRDMAKRARIEKDLIEKELVLRKQEAELASNKVDRLAEVAESVDRSECLADMFRRIFRCCPGIETWHNILRHSLGLLKGVFEQTIMGTVVEANDAYYRISGLSKNPDNVDDAFMKAVFEEDVPEIVAEWTALARGEPRTFQLKFRNRNHGLAACVPIKAADGTVTGVHGILTNITAMRHMNATEERFDRFLQIVPSGILITDAMGGVIFVNDGWFDLTGHVRTKSYDDIVWPNVILEEDQPMLMKYFKEVSEGNEVKFQIRTKKCYTNSAGENCGPAWVQVTGIPELNEEGGIERLISTASDISHLKFAERLQQARLDEAIEAQRQQENFVDMTSHEIRNPLSAVVHCADSIIDSLSDMSKLIARRGPAPRSNAKEADNETKLLTEAISSSLEAVETISSCTSHMRRIIDDILTLSKLDANLLKISPSPVDTNAFVNTIQKMLEIDAERVGVVLQAQADASVSRLNAEWVEIDPGRVTQVILNLVTNAIKFTKEESKANRHVSVEMGVSDTRPTTLPVDFTVASTIASDGLFNDDHSTEAPCYLWFVVKDTGCGMSASEQRRIFTRFAQGSVKTYSHYGGSGLGLFISRTLVELQGGEIGVASKQGKGSTFAFYIKTRRCPPPPAVALSTLPILHSKVSQLNLGAAAPRNAISVLIVEDNLVNQRVLSKQLTKAGYTTHVANNGLDALSFLATTRHWRTSSTSFSSPFSSSSDSTSFPSSFSDDDAAYLASLDGAADRKDVDVILMDIEMPVLDGLSAARRIRDLQKSGEIVTRCLPIVAVSANARAEQVKMALEAGMDDSIAKPFRIPDLTPKIERLANWARSQQQMGEQQQQQRD